jgi:hypothetical protein
MDLVLGVIIVLVILVIFVIRQTAKSENFDVYNNHTFGAEDVYNTELAKAKEPKIDFAGAKLVSRYTWADKDPLGRNVYDKYYEAVTKEKNYGDETPRKTGAIGGAGPYDSKFDLQPFNPPANIGSYNLRDMYDNDPVYITFMGEPITLAQANF